MNLLPYGLSDILPADAPPIWVLADWRPTAEDHRYTYVMHFPDKAMTYEVSIHVSKLRKTAVLQGLQNGAIKYIRLLSPPAGLDISKLHQPIWSAGFPEWESCIREILTQADWHIYDHASDMDIEVRRESWYYHSGLEPLRWRIHLPVHQAEWLGPKLSIDSGVLKIGMRSMGARGNTAVIELLLSWDANNPVTWKAFLDPASNDSGQVNEYECEGVYDRSGRFPMLNVYRQVHEWARSKIFTSSELLVMELD